MFSYRHSFHAGNHADVLKHSVLITLLDYFVQKPKGICLIDTHAGAGIYDLCSTHANISQEWRQGIDLIWHARQLSNPSLQRYKAVISDFNLTEKLHLYPGSSAMMGRLMRTQDYLHLFELHPTDIPILKNNLSCASTFNTTRIHIQANNGFSALKALLPPPSRRGLILIDPSYEDKRDYSYVISALTEGLKRFANGTYMIWYPCLPRYESRVFAKHLQQLPIQNWLQAELCISSNINTGLTRSGLFIINPPWNLEKSLTTLLPELVSLLGLDKTANYLLTAHRN